MAQEGSVARISQTENVPSRAEAASAETMQDKGRTARGGVLMPDHPVEVAIVGAGFAGIGVAVALQKVGCHDFTILERSGRVGGTWRDNTFPGLTCDVPSHLYSYSFAPNPDWSHSYARRAEIQAYVERVAGEHGLLDSIHFNTVVHQATWDEDAALWRLATSQGEIWVRALVTANGPFAEPAIPDIPGLDDFPGAVFHSGRWDHSCNLEGRRVAVIGAGASAIGFVPEIQPKVDKLYLFQRTPPWVIPKLDRPISDVEKFALRHVPGLQRVTRSALDAIFVLGHLALRRPKVMERLQVLVHRRIERWVPDKDKQQKLIPSYTLGCKRILLSNSWYPAIAEPNVEILDAGVSEVRGSTVVAANGSEVEVDVIIFGTGWQGNITTLPIRGRDGRLLHEHWTPTRKGYYGSTVAGFPNLFTMFGPNVANASSSAHVLIEIQSRYIADAVCTLRDARTVEIRPEVQEQWNKRVQEALAGTVWNTGGCTSYYLDTSGRNVAIYPWTTYRLARKMRKFDAHNYLITTVPPVGV